MKRESIIAIVIVAAILGWHAARWQTGHDCRYLGGFMTFGKVYVCEGMTESVKREMARGTE